jgi:hypothetical protein
MILKSIKGLFSKNSGNKFLQSVGDDINQNITVTGNVRGGIVQVGKVVVSQQKKVSPSVLALRSCIDSMVAVPGHIGKEIAAFEQNFRLGDYKEALPANSQVINEALDKLDLMCKDDGITLPGDWQKEYWRSGLINAIQKSEKEMILSFLLNADEDLIYWPTELVRRRSWPRWVFCTNFFTTDCSTIEYEMVLNHLVQAGLISQATPPDSRDPAPMRMYLHTTTELTRLIARLILRFGIKPAPPSGDYYKFLNED